MQDYSESLGTCVVGNQGGQNFHLFWQLLHLFRRFLRQIMAKLSLPCEENWDGIHLFGFTGCTFLAVGELKKTQFRSLALRVVKTSVDVREVKEESCASNEFGA